MALQAPTPRAHKHDVQRLARQPFTPQQWDEGDGGRGFGKQSPQELLERWRLRVLNRLARAGACPQRAGQGGGASHQLDGGTEGVSQPPNAE